MKLFWEQDCGNSIAIRQEDGQLMASIVADEDITEEHINNAHTICNAVNTWRPWIKVEEGLPGHSVWEAEADAGGVLRLELYSKPMMILSSICVAEDGVNLQHMQEFFASRRITHWRVLTLPTE